MEQIIKTVRLLNDSGRWDYHYHQRVFSNLQSQLDATSFPTSRIGEITDHVIDGTHFTPEYTDDSGVLFLMARNVKPFEISLDSVSYITPAEHKKIIRCKPETGDVLVTKDGTIGVAAVVPDFLPEFNIFVSLIKLRPKSIVSPHYLAIFLNSDLGQMQIRQQTKGASITHIHLEDMRRLRIPLPPRPIQDRIAQIMQDAYAERRAKLAEALLDGIDGFVFNQLNIHPESVVEATRFKKTISEILHGRFDVEYNMGFHKFDPYSDQVQPVQDVASFPSETRDPTQKPDIHFPYIDIASIDIHSGEIVETKTVLGSEAPSRARQVVRASDIIVSTVRPTRGATALISDEMNNFICSTGFTIVRASDKVLPEYLHTALRLSTTLEQLGRRSSGSSYPAVLTKDIKQVLIPVPHKEVQEIIATEIMNRRKKASILKVESEHCIDTAKRQVERMILGKDASA